MNRLDDIALLVLLVLTWVIAIALVAAPFVIMYIAFHNQGPGVPGPIPCSVGMYIDDAGLCRMRG